jgi:YcaO-like protein with predicted kinase domain
MVHWSLSSSTAKGFRVETHRTVAPAVTIDRVRRFMPAMGITRLGNVTGLDTVGIPTFVACRPNSRSLAVSQGKGLTPDAARASALMESVEAFHAERILLPLKLANASELQRGHRLVDIFSLARTTVRPLDLLTPFLWIEGWDLIQQEQVWLPHETVHIDSTLQARINPGIFCCSTNGLASGNHRLEAASHAICEVVERDSTALWCLLDPISQEETRVDLSTVDDASCLEVLRRYERACVAVGVWETTTNVGIPSFTCLVVDRREDSLRSLHSASGQGCHPSRAIALLRALTEAAQTRLTVISGSRDDVMRSDYDRHRNPDELQQVRALTNASTKGKAFRDGPDFASHTFEEDLAWELDSLRGVGIERVVVCDLTMEEFEIPVVKVVIPGLEGNHSFPNYLFGQRAQNQRAKSSD